MDSIDIVYFSPTGTTRKIVEQIAAGIGATDICSHDLTLQTTSRTIAMKHELTLVGVPVYAGRVPAVSLQRLEQLSGNNQPAVLVVLYGNRAYEDALIELQDIMEAKGFTVIAAAAFIGEHSYATQEYPVAAHRPDQDDLAKAFAFGQSVAAQLRTGRLTPKPLIPGDRPYRDRLPRPACAPEVDATRCTACNTCLTHCPTSAIAIAEGVMTTDPADCILCCACIKICPEHARILEHPMIQDRRRMLVANCSDRKEPDIFLAGSDKEMRD